MSCGRDSGKPRIVWLEILCFGWKEKEKEKENREERKCSHTQTILPQVNQLQRDFWLYSRLTEERIKLSGRWKYVHGSYFSNRFRRVLSTVYLRQGLHPISFHRMSLLRGQRVTFLAFLAGDSDKKRYIVVCLELSEVALDRPLASGPCVARPCVAGKWTLLNRSMDTRLWF